MAHLRAVPDPYDGDDGIDPAAAVAPETDEPDEVEGVEGGAEPETRRYPSTIGGAFYLSILAAAGTALFVTRTDWRLGIQMLGGCLLAAALLRLVLAKRDAGMLAVRHRAIDVFMLTGAGAALIVLATSIPPQPPV